MTKYVQYNTKFELIDVNQVINHLNTFYKEDGNAICLIC